ncbi:unnamed protein product [Ceratitis capitata]|uniref:(Mediterranean fruit fly) hypothetical protein n=1 Tax=Ceratitis capitata TaxID=7213 RepID=A0A811U3D5_CERCA|nr:unnamed protein product [Ceratitis capitata]
MEMMHMHLCYGIATTLQLVRLTEIANFLATKICCYLKSVFPLEWLMLHATLFDFGHSVNNNSPKKKYICPTQCVLRSFYLHCDTVLLILPIADSWSRGV